LLGIKIIKSLVHILYLLHQFFDVIVDFDVIVNNGLLTFFIQKDLFLLLILKIANSFRRGYKYKTTALADT